jgi:hypothetical protein
LDRAEEYVVTVFLKRKGRQVKTVSRKVERDDVAYTSRNPSIDYKDKNKMSPFTSCSAYESRFIVWQQQKSPCELLDKFVQPRPHNLHILNRDNKEGMKKIPSPILFGHYCTGLVIMTDFSNL